MYGDGSVVVTTPRWIGKRLVEKFVVGKTQWILEKLQHMSTRPKKMLDTRSAKEYAQNKKKALAVVERRLKYFNEIYNYSYKSISIRNQKTRWGSCSRQGTLSFNYKIVFLPEHLADYVIVHELCHLKEMNHSKKFWDLMAKTMPNHRARRRELRAL